MGIDSWFKVLQNAQILEQSPSDSAGNKMVGDMTRDADVLNKKQWSRKYPLLRSNP